MRHHFTRTAPLALALTVSFSIGCHYNYGDCEGPSEPDPFDRFERDAGHVDARRSDAGIACLSHEDCPEGRACIAGACSPADPCASDVDCDAGERCDARSTCIPRPADGSCTDARDCIAGQVCVEHQCAALDSVCHVDLDCGVGRGCIDNACRPLCVSDAECGADECIAGHCNPTLQCDALRPCPAGATCEAGRCAAGCLDASECARGELCERGLCVPDVSPHPFCASDADCAAGHPCLNGVCRTLCPGGTVEECQRSDAQFVSCMSVGGAGLCLMRSEAAPECVTPSDCASGERCIDALCR